MDSLYKAHVLSQLRLRMQAELSEFVSHKIPPVGHPLRYRFSSSKLYRKTLPSTRYVWLEWMLGEGVEREFTALLGWSHSGDVLPTNQSGDMRIHEMRGPVHTLSCGVLNVQQIEGRQAIGGFTIATPWDQLYALQPNTAEAERKRVMKKAYIEYLAVTDTERVVAVRSALDEAFSSILRVLPGFELQLERLPQ